MKFSVIFKFAQQTQWHAFGMEYISEGTPARIRRKIDGKLIHQLMDIDKIPRPRAARASAFYNLRILGHLLAQRPQFLAYNHGGRVDINRQAVDYPALLSLAIVKPAYVDHQLAALSHLNGLAAQSFRSVFKALVICCVDDSKFDLVSTPEIAHVGRNYRRYFTHVEVKDKEIVLAECRFQTPSDSRFNVIHFRRLKLIGHGQVDVRQCTGSGIERDVDGITAFEYQTLHQAVVGE